MLRNGTAGTGRPLRLALAGLLAVIFIGALNGGRAWASGPVLSLASVSNTTVAPGTDLNYFLSVTNTGDAATDGSEIDLTVTLPANVMAISAFGFGLTCTAGDGSPLPAAGTVRCTTFDMIAPGQQDTQIITVHVPDTASGVLTSSLNVTGGGAPPSTSVDPTTLSPTPPGFGIDAFDSRLLSDALGDPLTQAGGHPYALTTALDLNTMTNPQLVNTTPQYSPFTGDLWPVDPVRDILVNLPPGLIGDPSSVTQCTAAQLANAQAIVPVPLCASSSQVGVTFVRYNGSGVFGQTAPPVPVFNMVPPPGVPARFAFNAAGNIVTLDVRLRSNDDYGLSVDVRKVPEGLAIAGSTVTFWGVPADDSHDVERYCPPGTPAPCGAGLTPKAFLRNSTFCPSAGTGLTTALHVDSWFDPAPFNADGSPDLSDPRWHTATSISHLPPGYPALPGPNQSNWGAITGPTGCEGVPFDPTLDAKPIGQARAGMPTPFQFDLKLPQSSDPSSIAEGDLRKAVVTLPDGVHVSPSSANGLGACTPAQIGLVGTGFPEPNRIRFNTSDPACPDSSKLGTVRIDTPLLPDPLTGSVYLATPNDNPFGSLLAIYLVAQGSGVTIKLPGKIETSPSGRLTASFDDAPQTPFTELQLSFFGGPFAPLVLPDRCGVYTTNAQLTSWSGKTVSTESSFVVDHESDSSPCAGPTFSPSFHAGTVNPVAGKTSSFLLSFGRSDRDRQLSSVAVDLPNGLIGPPADVVLCPEGAANAGTCLESARIGSVTVGAGAGTNPFWISSGRVYLTDRYKGARWGLSIVVPAIAGPFDLGNVVVRSALYVDPHTGALKVVSDPLPTALQGIPLDVREVRVLIDRPHFFLNPTSCAEKRIFGTIAAVDGTVAHTSTRFQATECASLSFAPRMSLTVGAPHHTRAGVSTPLTATVRQTKGQANLRAVGVSLPTTLNALLPVLNRACTQTQFDAGHCGGARAGSAVAVTPLLRDPERGSVFFVRKPKRVLPDLVVALRGDVAIDLAGKVNVDRKTNRLTTRFDGIPDFAISKFSLRLVAGANGPLGTTTNLCSKKAKRATARIGFRAQNGKVLNVKQRLRIRGCPRKR